MTVFTSDLLDLALWAALIEFVGALLIISYLLLALWTLPRARDVQLTRLQAANWSGNWFKLQIGCNVAQNNPIAHILTFTAIFALRTVLKRVLIWEHLRPSVVQPV